MVSADRFRDPMEVLAEQFVADLRSGMPTSVEDYASRHSELARDIRQLFPTLVDLERISSREFADANSCPASARLGDFRLMRQIGRGGMGVVYEAVQESLGRTVAIKVLSHSVLNSPSLRERFLRESQAAARLHHTNIVPVFGCGQHEGTSFYVMQFIDGVGCDEVIQGNALPSAMSLRNNWKAIASRMADVAEAIQHAHEQGILHRDIKPANIILDRQGKVWITDFGLAKAIDNEALTATGDTVGTLRYMAPEQLDGKSDQRTDLFALGLTMYELLAWQPAYDDTDRGSLLQRVATAMPPRPRRVNPSIPKDLETIVLKAIAHNPASRYPTASEMASDLRRFVDDLPVKARRISPIEQGWRWSKRNRAVAFLGCTTMCLSIALSCLLWIALARTSSNLSRESIQREAAVAERDQADRTRQRAEANLRIALAEFDSIFAALAGDAPSAGADSRQLFASADAPEVSQEVANVLDSLLQFYTKFVNENGEQPELRRQLILAHQRAGDIHRLLANQDKAKAAYLHALSLFNYKESDSATVYLDKARLHSRLGTVYVALGKFDHAMREFHDGTTSLFEYLDVCADPEEAKFELARIHQNRAELLSIEAHHREQRREVDLAIELLEELTRSETAEPEYQLHLATAYHQRHDVDYRYGKRTHDRENAIDLLRTLVANYPTVPKYRYCLSDLLSQEPPTKLANNDDGSTSNASPTEKRLRQALALSRGLVQSSPAVPSYAYLHGRNLAAVAGLLDAQGKHDDAEIHYRRAVSRHQGVASRFPNVPKYQHALAASKYQFAQYLAEQGRPADARPLLEASIKGRRELLDIARHNRAETEELGQQYHDLARILIALDDRQQADEAMRSAQQLYGQLDRMDQHRPPHERKLRRWDNPDHCRHHRRPPPPPR